MDRVIVTGGAGFVGSHVCKQLKLAGYVPVTFDSLGTGWKDAVRFGPFVRGDIMSLHELGSAFEEWRPVAVVHLAALTSVEESVSKPEEYRYCNVEGTRNVVRAMLDHDCNVIVFSSTCAVYGNAPSGLVDESSPTNPESPYAETKLAAEEFLSGAALEDGIRSTVFRYFNVAGSDPDSEIGEWRTTPSNLIPAVLECAVGARTRFEIFGTDYPTPDGTCIRDYVHAIDVADAHVAGLKALLNGEPGRLFNIGTGAGEFSQGSRGMLPEDYRCRLSGKGICTTARGRCKDSQRLREGTGRTELVRRTVSTRQHNHRCLELETNRRLRPIA